MEIVLVSRNVHKIREMKEMFRSLPFVETLTLHQFPDCELPVEAGSTFEENALNKARFVAKTLKKWVVADDSGLVVPILDGAPGVLSKRYAGEKATDRDNRKKLLEELNNRVDLERSAFYECCLALVSPDGMEKTFSAVCEGYILTEERGSNGFGYDPLFQKHDYDKTFAEVEESTKNRISHRRKAFDKLATVLEALIAKRAKCTI